MNIYNSLNEIPSNEKTALTIGTFDGLHLGHRAILDELLRAATGLGGRSMVLTFDPHPQEVLRKTGSAVPILTPIKQKLQLLKAFGIDGAIVLPFTQEFAATPWQHFIDQLIECTGLAHMVVGHDHAFGRNREGNAESLREYGAEKGFTFTQVGPLFVDGEMISSTKIRNALSEGDVEQANRWLDRPYALTGTVVQGDGRGRQIGVPTANIKPLNQNQLVPANGVYAVQVQIAGEEEWHKGMANIGVRPTFTDGSERTIEVHLLDFSDELYHREVTVEFLKFIRSERKFGSKEEFLAQLERDREACNDS
ncbi:MAG: bifunctional riboflavin kinase/FAD synthetase [Candidatus Kapaibacterium sp.]